MIRLIRKHSKNISYKLKTLFADKVSKKRRVLKKYKMSSKQLIILTYLSTFVLISMVIVGFVGIIILAVISRQLPNPNQLLERSYELSTKIFDRQNKPIFEVYGEKNRTLVKIDEIAPFVANATLAVEDSEFYAHKGFSIRGMARAARNTLTGQGLQGGSTLTQQVIKNTLLSQERTLSRKIKELILSLQLENRYSKEEILQMYLNESPYGGQNYGVFTAAKAYFNKHPKDLSLAESAYLAGLPQSPSYYSQFGANPEAGLVRKDTVLQLMKDKGWLGKDGNRYYISDEDYNAAIAEPLEFQSASVSFEAPHFVFYVKQQLIDLFGEDFVEQGGLQVRTTLDLEVQEKAQEIVYGNVEDSVGYNVYNGALVALDPKNGDILAMVGSKGYFLESYPQLCKSGITGEGSCLFEPQLNVATANRQPGSAIKPITYATMLKNGYTAAFKFLDVPTRFPGSAPEKPYDPVNYDGIFRGPMSLRKSLGNSLNIPAVKALSIVGINDMIDLAEEMGITTFTDRSRYGLALTLGGGETKLLELTGAYSTLANKGVFNQPNSIIEVTDARGNSLYKAPASGGKKVLGEDVAFLISDILSDDGARSTVFGTGSLLHFPGFQVAAKTGTTDDKRDNYFFGYTPSVVVGTWVGNNNNDAMNPAIASGITGASPIGHDFLKYYLEYKFKDNPEKFSPPDNVVKITVDDLTGMQPYGDRSTRSEWFIKGTEPPSVSDWYKRLQICKIDGKLANDSCKDADEEEEKTFIDIQAEKEEWQPYVNKWISENYSDNEEYFPPQTHTCLSFEEDGDIKDDDKVCVEILYYEDGDTVPLDFRLSVETSSANDIDSVKVYLDGNEVTTDKSAPYGYNFELDASSIGKHSFRVKAEDDDGNEAEKEITLNVVGYQLN